MSDRIYVRGFANDLPLDQLKQKFRQFGRIKSTYIVQETEPKPKLFAIVRFYNPDSAPKAIAEVHGSVEGQCTWYVAQCEKKTQRHQQLVSVFNQSTQSYLKKNLYVRDFPEDWTENNLREIFDKYGNVTSAKISGNKAFVCFETEEEAKAAVAGEKKKTYGTKYLYVTLWTIKRDLDGKLRSTKTKRSRKNMPQDLQNSEEQGEVEVGEDYDIGEAVPKQQIPS